MKTFTLFLLSTALVIAGCGKEAGDSADAEPPLISLTSPGQAQAFAVGQSVGISGTVTDNKKIYEVHLEIRNTTTGVLLAHEHYRPDGATYTLTRALTPAATGSYRIKVEAEDEKRNKSVTEVTVSAN